MHWTSLVTICDLIATFAFAAVGARVAASKGMDIGGISLIAAVSSLAGGTLRNLFLLKSPSWILNPWLLSSVLLAIIFTIIRGSSEPVGRLIVSLDTFGLAVATVSSTEFALRLNCGPVIATVLGLVGGVTGGLLRDILAQVEPVLLHRETIATSCLAGAAVFVSLNELHINRLIPVLLGGVVVVLIRELSIYFHWNLPKISRE
ncbi:MAG: TRIC cation channel family protein [Actinomycetes bacterium]